MSHIHPPKALCIQIFMTLHQCHFISAIYLSKLFFKMTTFTVCLFIFKFIFTFSSQFYCHVYIVSLPFPNGLRPSFIVVYLCLSLLSILITLRLCLAILTPLIISHSSCYFFFFLFPSFPHLKILREHSFSCDDVRLLPSSHLMFGEAIVLP